MHVEEQERKKKKNEKKQTRKKNRGENLDKTKKISVTPPKKKRDTK
jgi:hypothetical protein